MTKEKTELEFLEEWLLLQKYEFKLLTVVTVLADSNRAFRGTLSELCNELSIKNCTVNKNKIKESLHFLEDNDYLKLIVDKDIYTISLAYAAEKSKNVLKLKKAWYEIIRTADSEASWEALLKVFLTILDFSQDQIYTYKQIGSMTNTSPQVVGRCVKTLKKLKFDDIAINVELFKTKDKNGDYKTLGQSYSKVYNWE